VLERWNERNVRVKGKEYIAKTIVTTELLAEIALKYGGGMP
jgi:hypothetical protein